MGEYTPNTNYLNHQILTARIAHSQRLFNGFTAFLFTVDKSSNSMSEKHNFGIAPVTCHSFNRDRTGLALSLNDSNVKIYKKSGQKWQETDTLSEHGQRVTGIDWAPDSNRIVTCSADRNAFVWMLEGDKWKQVLVIPRINRAATCVKWSPKENKFAVGSGSRLIAICYYDVENNWWVSRHIKKPIRSTVTCLDWHPNNVLLAAGSTDFKCRVFSGYQKEVDEKPGPSSWGSKMPFGNLMAEFSNGGGGWVHSVSFSPSGDKVAWVGHDSSVSVADATMGNQLMVIKESFLPFMSITWVTENSMVAAGYDCNPMVFTYTGSKINMGAKLDQPQEKQSGNIRCSSINEMPKDWNPNCLPKNGDSEDGGEESEIDVIASAMNRFKNLDKKGTGSDTATELKTQHQNTITQVSIHTGTKGDASKVATSGVDGNVILWDLKSLESSIQGLRIS
ncbi:actin-related protein 2/3 complex subunit 1a [Plakobranchus ocellatus]|uniref:Arp2/3 complex 41 kDa subunit n=1 Tax=Plakobranchus ocellatus TaxID=259542 RepID=A0AAV4ACS3_9GAST|nr:actin-related protein 2/3 complex subunit 1a [Plakobranchus ocellatus]